MSPHSPVFAVTYVSYQGDSEHMTTLDMHQTEKPTNELLVTPTLSGL